MSTRETSPEIASLAGIVLGQTPREGDANLAFNALLVQAKKLAASCLSQTEPATVEPGELQFNIAAKVTVELEKMTNAITGAVEGGFGSWLQSLKYDSSEPVSVRLAAASRGTAQVVWYNDPAFWAAGGKAVATYDLPTDDEGVGNGQAVLDINALVRGAQTMAQKATPHFTDLVNETDDAITHDVFMQCVILGDVIYG